MENSVEVTKDHPNENEQSCSELAGKGTNPLHLRSARTGSRAELAGDGAGFRPGLAGLEVADAERGILCDWLRGHICLSGWS